MQKIVINSCYGGFGLSNKAALWLLNNGLEFNEFVRMELAENPDYTTDIVEEVVRRDDPLLIQVVETLGKEAYGSHASLKIVEIPDDVEWEISDYDGIETVRERHRYWG